ncbi:hypothetical protein ACWKWC_04620 [Geodermatophilus nigrescens]
MWLTVPLHVLLAVVLVLDVRAAVFWSRVGGPLGVPVTVAAAVAVLALLLLTSDARRQWSRSGPADDGL